MKKKLTGETRISLSQIDWTPYFYMVLDKSGKYKIGDLVEWKDGLHEKTVNGWVKVPREKDRNGNEIFRTKSIARISDSDFYNSSRSFLLPAIDVPAWNKEVPESLRKPLLIKRHIIELQKTKHKEFNGQDKEIIHFALTKGTVAKFNHPDKKPNYCVIARSGHYWYWATIDTDPTKKYNEIVDWRKVNESKVKPDMKK